MRLAGRGGSALPQGRRRRPCRACQSRIDPDEGLALEWASLRLDAHLSVAALTAFAEAIGWPDGGWIRRRREAQLLANSEAAAKVAAYFASEPPQTSAE